MLNTACAEKTKNAVKKVIVGQFFHESNSFADSLTGADEFMTMIGDEINLSGSDSQDTLGAFGKKASYYGWDLIPTIDAGAIPSGEIEKEVYETAKKEMLSIINKNLPVDGVLLSLHGASMVDGYDDSDGDLLKTIRKTVGPNVPILATLDKHANVSQLMVQSADVLLAYNKEPHEDPYERGLEAADLLNDMFHDKICPITTCIHPPMLVPAINGCTNEEPMKSIMSKAYEYEKDENVIDVSVLIGFYGSDKPDAGSCVLVTTNGDKELSGRIAIDMAKLLWDKRNDFFIELTSVDDAIAKANREGGLWAFIDESDDPLGGAPGDNVIILKKLMRHNIHSAALSPIADEEILEKALEAGEGGKISGLLGGKKDPKYGAPVAIKAIVKKIITEPIRTCSWDEHRMDVGRLAILDHDGIIILVSEQKIGTESINIFEELGLDINDYHIIVMKGLGNTIKLSYGNAPKGYIEVQGEGCTNPDVTKLGEFKKLERPCFPFDKDVQVSTMVLKNGSIYTMDERNTIASAIVINNNKIIYIGDDETAGSYIGKNTKVIDLQRKMVVPGFIDGHAHPPGNAIIQGQIDLVHCHQSIPAYQEEIQKYAADHENDEFLTGVGLRLIDFGEKGPDKNFLDNLVSNKPLILRDASGQYVLLNSAALAACKITADTEMPLGVTMIKDENSEPTGLFLDGTMFMDMGGYLQGFEPEIMEPTEAGFRKEWEAYEQEALAKGITGICNGLSFDTEIRPIIETLRKENKLNLRTAWLCSSLPGMESTVEETLAIMENAQQYQSDWQTTKGVKLYIDGTPYGASAYLLESYESNERFEAGYKGESSYSDEDLKQIVTALDKAGYQIHGHCMGDGSVHQLIDAIEYAYEKNGRRDARHTVVHANMICTEDIQRMADLGITAAMQVAWAWNDPFILKMTELYVGEKRAKAQYRVRDMIEAGVNIVASSDYSFSDSTGGWSPLAGIETGVTRTISETALQDDPKYILGQEQAVTVMDMLKMYTINAARNMFMEDSIGTLEPGKKADMLILSQDITKIDPKFISETEVVATIVDGKERYHI